MQDKYDSKGIIFSPEFLREGKALLCNLYPSESLLAIQRKKLKFFQAY